MFLRLVICLISFVTCVCADCSVFLSVFFTFSLFLFFTSVCTLCTTDIINKNIAVIQLRPRRRDATIHRPAVGGWLDSARSLAASMAAANSLQTPSDDDDDDDDGDRPARVMLSSRGRSAASEVLRGTAPS